MKTGGAIDFDDGNSQFSKVLKVISRICPRDHWMLATIDGVQIGDGGNCHC